MKFADRLKFTATGTSAATITVGAAVAACRTLAQVIADGALTVGDTNVPFTTTDGTAWEDSLFTVTSATVLTRTSVLASSAGGTTPATFSGALTVFNAVPGSILSRIPVDSEAAFSLSVPLTQAGTAWMPQQTVSGALNFTPAANAVKGAFAYVRLVADGVNAPTWTGFTEEIGSAGYDNRNGIVNRLQFAYDGSDYWVAVSQAANAVAVAPAASALTISPTTASVASGSPVTFTVGTNNPLTGAQTESVTLTAPVAGTWSVNPVTLNASTATAATTFTPSATGSGNVTAAASGTPTLTSASAALTVTASATVPGAPTIGTAMAGDTTASFAFTAPASNGGASIDTYQLTVYNTSNAVVGTFNGTTSPISATGLTDGTGYYGKVAAHNTAGYGAQSAASNTVTPAAATASNVRLSPTNSIIESGTGPYSYTGGGSANAAFSNAFGGLSSTGIPANGDGWLSFVVGGFASTSEPMLGINTGSTLITFGSLPCAFYPQGSSNKYIPWTSGTSGTPTNVVTPANGDVMRLRRSGTSVIAEVSKDSGSTWTTIYTWTAQTTAAVKFQVMPEYSSQANNLQGSGLA